MDLLEYEGKKLFAKYGISTPKGRVVSSLKEAKRASSISENLVLKAQIPSGKRGKSGGIMSATEKDLVDKCRRMFSREVRGLKVREILVEERLLVDRELYLSLTISREDKSVMVLFSENGGMDVEDLAAKHEDKLVKCKISQLIEKKRPFVLFNKRTKQNGLVEKRINILIKKLYALMTDRDASLVEINPLVVVKNDVIALDSKIVIDDNAAYRHKEFAHVMMRERKLLSKEEQRAAELGLHYVGLRGDIGVIGNGAGLVMATLDLLAHHGGKPANFLDLGGGADRQSVIDALEVCLMNKEVKALFINIFGGITRCDEIAEGMIGYVQKKRISLPVVVRMIGTNESRAKALLMRSGAEMHDSMEICAMRAVQLAKNKRQAARTKR